MQTSQYGIYQKDLWSTVSLTLHSNRGQPESFHHYGKSESLLVQSLPLALLSAAASVTLLIEDKALQRQDNTTYNTDLKKHTGFSSIQSHISLFSENQLRN